MACLKILLRDVYPIHDAGKGAGEFGRHERVERNADRSTQTHHDIREPPGKMTSRNSFRCGVPSICAARINPLSTFWTPR